MKYLVKHWINVDMIAEEIIEDENINFETHCIKGYKDRVESVNYSTVIRPSRFKNDIEWI